jgi:hypothetical protein
MKHVGNTYGRVSSLLRDDVRPLGMLCEAGPLRVMRELTAGIVFTGSVQLTNAARLFCTTANQLCTAVERMGGHLGDASWDHREWAAQVLRLQPRRSRRTTCCRWTAASWPSPTPAACSTCAR